MISPDTTPDPDPVPMLLGTQDAAHALNVRRETCDELAAILRDNGHAPAANAQRCAQAATDHTLAQTRRATLRQLLDSVDLAMLTELRETVAEAEENALRNTIARRLHLLAPANGRRYTHAIFYASRSKLGMSHADYRPRDVELYDEEHDNPTVVDLNDEELSAALGTLATLLRPDDDAELTVDLACTVTTTG